MIDKIQAPTFSGYQPSSNGNQARCSCDDAPSTSTYYLISLILFIKQCMFILLCIIYRALYAYTQSEGLVIVIWQSILNIIGDPKIKKGQLWSI